MATPVRFELTRKKEEELRDFLTFSPKFPTLSPIMSDSQGRPDPFLVGCEPEIPWNQWKKIFNVYVQRRDIHLTRLRESRSRSPPTQGTGRGVSPSSASTSPGGAQQTPAYPDKEKNLDLFSLLGSEGQRLFMGTADCDNFDRAHADVIATCDGLFSVKVNRLIALKKFRGRLQRSGETASEWSAELRVLAKDCGFANVNAENREIADTLVLNCFDRDLQQKLFAQHADSTLAQILAFMSTEEQSKVDVKELTSGSTGALRTGQYKSRNKAPAAVDKAKSPSCDGCGKIGHKYRSNQCPAKGKKCDFCHVLDHFSSVCRKRNNSTKSNHKPSQATLSCLAPAARVATLACSDSRIRCKLLLQPLHRKSKKRAAYFLADTGSQATTLTESVYKRLFPNVPMHGPQASLHNFDSSEAPAPLGSVRMVVTFADRSAEIDVNVVQDKCLSLLGIDDMALLGMQIDTPNRKVYSVSRSSLLSPQDLHTSLLKEFPRLFSDGIGKISGFQHTIQLKENAKPVKCKLRHPPVAIKEKGSEALDVLIDQDVAEHADKSDWVHPVHFVWKPDKDVRTTVDFSPGLNKNLVPASHPLPLPSDIFRSVSEDKFFSIGDVVQAYHSVPLDPASRPLTAFLTESHGLLQFKRLPQGMTDSGAVFQRCIEKCLEGLPGVHPYIDDILISGKTREEHDYRLREVCKRLEETGFRLKKSKMVVAQQEVCFLGHILKATPNGTTYCPDPRNSDAIRKLHPPSDVQGVRKFLGCCNYYSKHIKNYAELSEPLLKLTRKNIKFEWTDLCQKSFDLLKAEISSPRVLTPFNPRFPTILTADASDVGLGAVLSQIQGQEDRPIAFASKTLGSAERNYSTPERETLASVWATEHFEKFLLGRHFTLQTDQSSLQTLLQRFTDKRASKRIARWFDRLRHFDYSVKHIPGKKNVCADMLSRLGANLEPSSDPVLPDDDDQVIVCALSSSVNVPVSELVTESHSDPEFKQIRQYLQSDSWPPRKQIPASLRGYFDVRDQLSVFDSCLFRGEQWVVPSSLRQRILTLLHSGHPGITRMKQKYKDSYYWPGGSTMVEDYIRHCTPCCLSGKSTRPEPVPVTAVQPPSRPWQKVGIDITGPFWSAPKHQQNIVVVSDYFSKFPEIFFTQSTTSGQIISFLDEVFARYGNPEELISDNGPQFVSHEFKSFLARKNIKHNPAAVYNPQQNGLVEVFNRSLKFNSRVISTQGGSFKSGMLSLLASFRSTAPENGKSPSELLFGWKIRSDSDIRNPLLLPEGEVRAKLISSRPENLSLEDRNQIVQSKFQKRRYGLLNGRRPKYPYKVGDTVCHKRPSADVRKGLTPLSKPLRITGISGRWLYKLEDGQIWNARKLIRFRSGEVAPSLEEIEEREFMTSQGPARQLQLPNSPQGPRRTTRVNAGVPPDRFSP